jgi:hypothetical protein
LCTPQRPTLTDVIVVFRNALPQLEQFLKVVRRKRLWDIWCRVVKARTALLKGLLNEYRKTCQPETILPGVGDLYHMEPFQVVLDTPLDADDDDVINVDSFAQAMVRLPELADAWRERALEQLRNVVRRPWPGKDEADGYLSDNGSELTSLSDLSSESDDEDTLRCKRTSRHIRRSFSPGANRIRPLPLPAPGADVDVLDLAASLTECRRFGGLRLPRAGLAHHCFNFWGNGLGGCGRSWRDKRAAFEVHDLSHPSQPHGDRVCRFRDALGHDSAPWAPGCLRLSASTRAAVVRVIKLAGCDPAAVTLAEMDVGEVRYACRCQYCAQKGFMVVMDWRNAIEHLVRILASFHTLHDTLT